MKNMYLILTMLFLFTGCNEEESKQQENSIYGTWQLTKRTGNNADDTPNDWENVNNGFILKFEDNLTFESNESTICENSLNTGEFSLSTTNNDTKDIIEITINNCDSSSNGSFIRVFYYYFNGSDLVLVPKEPACDEGCAFLYNKTE